MNKYVVNREFMQKKQHLPWGGLPQVKVWVARWKFWRLLQKWINMGKSGLSFTTKQYSLKGNRLDYRPLFRKGACASRLAIGLRDQWK